MDNKSRYLALFVIAIMLTLSFQTFGQPPHAAPQVTEAAPLNPPSTSAPTVPSSPTPSSEKEKDEILRAVSDIAKAAIETNRETMEKTATFYQKKVEQETRFFEYGMTVIGGGVTFFVAVISLLLSFFGIKGYASLRQYTVDKCDLIAADFSKRLESEVANKFPSIMGEIQAKAHKTLQALAKNCDASISINLAADPGTPREKRDAFYSKALKCLEESLAVDDDIDAGIRGYTYAMRAYIRRHTGDLPGVISDI